MEEKQRKKRLLIRKIVQIAVVIVLVSITQYYYSKYKSVGKELTALVENYNKACPMMISNDIRMESVNTLPHNTVQYDFTLVNVQKESIKVEDLKKSVEKEIMASSKTNPSLQAFREDDSTVIYSYKDSNQNELFKITLTPDMYQ
jgi:hypothetical protein